MGKKRSTHSLVLTISILGLTAFFVLAVSLSSGNQADDMAKISKGKVTYHEFCLSCHGEYGKGEEPISEFVTPADLTILSSSNDGPFPEERVIDVIKGAVRVDAHMKGEELLWGDAFTKVEEEGGEEAVAEKIDAVVHYLKSIQEKDEDWDEEPYEDIDEDECQTFGELYFDYIKRYSTEAKRRILNDSQEMCRVVKCWLDVMGFYVESVVIAGKKEYYKAIISGYHVDNAAPEYRESFEVARGSERKRGLFETRLTMDEDQVVLLFNKSDLENYGIKLLKFDSEFGMVEIRKGVPGKR